jgi:hypothetical protein
LLDRNRIRISNPGCRSLSGARFGHHSHKLPGPVIFVATSSNAVLSASCVEICQRQVEHGSVPFRSIGSTLGTRVPRSDTIKVAGIGVTFSHGDADMAEKITIVSLFAKFAKSDGAITRMEIAFFDDFIDGLTDEAADKKIYIAAFNKAKDEVISVYAIARKIAETAETSDFIAEIYDALGQIALVDGSLTSVKHEILKEIPVHLGLHRSV